MAAAMRWVAGPMEIEVTFLALLADIDIDDPRLIRCMDVLPTAALQSTVHGEQLALSAG